MDTDAIIVGAGPIGLEMAVAFQELGVSYRQFDGQQLGHTIAWFPRQAHFFSSPERIAIAGVPLLTVDQSKATREEYLTYLAAVVQQFRLHLEVYERVTRITPQIESGERRFRVETESARGRREFTCRHVVAAIGDMHQPRPLALPNGEAIPGSDLPHVHAYFVEPHPYLGCHVLIIGGRNSAVEAAIRCHRAGAHVSLSYRRAEIDPSVKYWLKPEIEWLIKTGEIAFCPNTLPTAITPTHVTLSTTRDGHSVAHEGQVTKVAADFVLPLIGFQMNPSLLAEAGVELVGDNRRPWVDSTTMQTNVPGLFVAGTAAAGTQRRYRLFIENGHSHVLRIARTITGRDPVRINRLAHTRLHEDPLAQEV